MGIITRPAVHKQRGNIMQRVLVFAAICAIALADQSAWAWTTPTDLSQALLPESTVSKAAIARLRQQGQEGLDALAAERAVLSQRLDQAPDERAKNMLTADIARLDRVIDQVGGARYCSVSRLFWHTDLEAAKAVAAKSGKPILSLRMLGKLTDEYSCANSRFFRSTLYANREISDFLREHYVLHWQSVRPVPRITVDFGDGRRIERTITGNSAHYVLTPAGQPLDVLPGLYGPQAFVAWLRRSEQLAAIFQKADPSQRNTILQTYHSNCRMNVARLWQQDLLAVAPGLVTETAPANSPQGAAAAPPNGAAPGNAAPANRQPAPPAGVAAARAMSKSVVEVPLLRALAVDIPRLERSIDEATWNKIAALHADEARLDGTARDIIRRENPGDAVKAGEITITKRKVESPLMRMVRNLESAVSLDTVRNEYLLHRRVHEWFAAGEAPADVQPLNERVYAELFLTPSTDPWLGLVPPDTYTALDRGGLVVEKSAGP